MLDIDGFLTSTEFLATLAGFVTYLISTFLNGLLGGLFGLNT